MKGSWDRLGQGSRDSGGSGILRSNGGRKSRVWGLEGLGSEG